MKAEFPKTVGGPLYLKAGAFIPTCEPGEFIGQKKIEHIELNLYPSGEKRTHAVNFMTRAKADEVLVNGKPVEFGVRKDGWCESVEDGFVSVPVKESGEEIVIVIR